MKIMLIILMVFSVSCGGGGLDRIADVIDDLAAEYDEQEGNVNDDIEDRDDLTEEGIVIVSGKPANLNFIGTFEKRNGFQFCTEFPQIIRIYKGGKKVYVETNRGELISKGKIFQDGTVDFDIDVYNEFYGYSYTLPCTCDYDSDTWYGKKLDCDCESCDIIYEEFQ